MDTIENVPKDPRLFDEEIDVKKYVEKGQKGSEKILGYVGVIVSAVQPDINSLGNLGDRAEETSHQSDYNASVVMSLVADKDQEPAFQKYVSKKFSIMSRSLM
jgi:hypothetical protein